MQRLTFKYCQVCTYETFRANFIRLLIIAYLTSCDVKLRFRAKFSSFIYDQPCQYWSITSQEHVDIEHECDGCLSILLLFTGYYFDRYIKLQRLPLSILGKYLKSFVENAIYIVINLNYLRIKLLKYTEKMYLPLLQKYTLTL